MCLFYFALGVYVCQYHQFVTWMTNDDLDLTSKGPQTKYYPVICLKRQSRTTRNFTLNCFDRDSYQKNSEPSFSALSVHHPALPVDRYVSAQLRTLKNISRKRQKHEKHNLEMWTRDKLRRYQMMSCCIPTWLATDLPHEFIGKIVGYLRKKM